MVSMIYSIPWFGLMWLQLGVEHILLNPNMLASPCTSKTQIPPRRSCRHRNNNFNVSKWKRNADTSRWYPPNETAWCFIHPGLTNSASWAMPWDLMRIRCFFRHPRCSMFALERPWGQLVVPWKTIKTHGKHETKQIEHGLTMIVWWIILYQRYAEGDG